MDVRFAHGVRLFGPVPRPARHVHVAGDAAQRLLDADRAAGRNAVAGLQAVRIRRRRVVRLRLLAQHAVDLDRLEEGHRLGQVGHAEPGRKMGGLLV